MAGIWGVDREECDRAEVRDFLNGLTDGLTLENGAGEELFAL